MYASVHETDETNNQIVKNARTTTPPIAIPTTKLVDMVDEPDEGDGGVYDDGGGCEDHVVPEEGSELLVAGGDGVEPDGGGGDEKESGVGGGELADAGGGGEVDGTGVESGGGGKGTTGVGEDVAGGGDVASGFSIRANHLRL
ncbi:hypothetical protein F0562_022203 [Nyssa sinensis]|uniref:Uncharacterized protein n=1 Tax=Nyssa sinensis TaxID=561372 RepID=A0A5J5BSI5_9ASTE|nr:hypothetical protein F0562_022203 [Nyssa sinensis]